MIRRFLCWIGVHGWTIWQGIDFIYDEEGLVEGYNRRTRYCLNCGKEDFETWDGKGQSFGPWG